jgi:hypothetical protein
MGNIIGIDGLVADIDEFVVDTLGVTGKKHPLESPVGQVHELFACRSAVGKYIVEDVF